MLENKLIYEDGIIKYIEDGHEVDVTEYVSKIAHKKFQEDKRSSHLYTKEKMFFLPISVEKYQDLFVKCKFSDIKALARDMMQKVKQCDAGMVESRFFDELSHGSCVFQVVNGEYDLVESLNLSDMQETILTERLDKKILSHIKAGKPFIRVVWR